MGSSYWSDDFYRDRVAVRSKTGADAFAYNHDVNTGKAARVVHAKMSPKDVLREARDSTEHPESLPIGVMLDVTGSMRDLPRTIQAKLPTLLGLLTRRGYAKDPQILFGAIGDEFSDSGSLQVGQFESGIEMDDDLGRFWLEGGGGGGEPRESYQNAIYFFARHTVTDQSEKRKGKGYLFIIGDEKPYPVVSRRTLVNLIGTTLKADIPTEDIIKECREKYHIFFILPKDASHGRDSSIKSEWERLLGPEHVIHLDDVSAISETIALKVGLCQGTARMSEVEKDLKAEGVSDHISKMVASAVGASSGGGVVRL